MVSVKILVIDIRKLIELEFVSNRSEMEDRKIERRRSLVLGYREAGVTLDGT